MREKETFWQIIGRNKSKESNEKENQQLLIQRFREERRRKEREKKEKRKRKEENLESGCNSISQETLDTLKNNSRNFNSSVLLYQRENRKRKLEKEGKERSGEEIK